MINKPLISVVVPTYNRGEPLVTTLKTLLKQSYDRYEIIVVDQSDKLFSTKEKFLRAHPEIRYFETSPPNAAAAKNFGVTKAKGEVILFVDDDIKADKELLANHISAFAKASVDGQAEIIGVAGRVTTPGEKEEVKRLNVGKVWPWGWVSGGFSSKVRQKVMGVYGCNTSWQKSIFQKIGGFDTGYVGNAIREETDVALRAGRYGKIIFEPTAQVVHCRALSGGGRKDNRLKWYEDFFNNETVFMLKWIKWYWWPVFWTIRWQYVARCMFGIGREVSWRSMRTPFRGVRRGIRVRRGKK